MHPGYDKRRKTVCTVCGVDCKNFDTFEIHWNLLHPGESIELLPGEIVETPENSEGMIDHSASPEASLDSNDGEWRTRRRTTRRRRKSSSKSKKKATAASTIIRVPRSALDAAVKSRVPPKTPMIDLCNSDDDDDDDDNYEKQGPDTNQQQNMSRSTEITTARTLSTNLPLATASEASTRTATTSLTNPRPPTPKLASRSAPVLLDDILGENGLIRALAVDIGNLRRACDEARSAYNASPALDVQQLRAREAMKEAVAKILHVSAALTSHRTQVDAEIETLLSVASGVVSDGIFAIGKSACLSNKEFDVDQFESLLSKRKRSE